MLLNLLLKNSPPSLRVLLVDIFNQDCFSNVNSLSDWKNLNSFLKECLLKFLVMNPSEHLNANSISNNSLVPSFADKYTFSTLLHSAAKKGDIPKLSELLNFVEKEGTCVSSVKKFQASCFTWSLVLQTYINAKQMVAAAKIFCTLFDRSKSNNSLFNVIHVNLMLRGLINTSCSDLAIILFLKFDTMSKYEMLKSVQFDISADQNIQNVKSLLDNVSCLNVLPDLRSFELIMDACQKMYSSNPDKWKFVLLAIINGPVSILKNESNMIRNFSSNRSFGYKNWERVLSGLLPLLASFSALKEIESILLVMSTYKISPTKENILDSIQIA